MDPLVPNQVRYQTAPHSDKLEIIAFSRAVFALNLKFIARARDLPGLTFSATQELLFAE